jgi:hypothetical protein
VDVEIQSGFVPFATVLSYPPSRTIGVAVGVGDGATVGVGDGDGATVGVGDGAATPACVIV